MTSNNNWHKIIFYITAFVIFLIVAFPAVHIPFHSDDYMYFRMGVGIEGKIAHYMNWSGRFITDYTSSLLLTLLPKWAYMLINSAVLVITLVCVSLIPSIASGKSYYKGCSLTLVTVFFVYWLANPNLGQTTFWLVGSANYLWPIMWVSLYVLFYLHLINKKDINITKLFVLGLLAFFSGLSNEAVGFCSVLLTLVLGAVNHKKRKIVLVSIIFVVTGFLILYFAPGNYKRLTHEMFASWLNTPFFQKIYLHLFDRTPWAFGQFWPAFVTIIAIGITSKFNELKEEISFKVPIIFATYCLLALVAVVIFVRSPVMPPRSLNTSLYFLVVTLSFTCYYSFYRQDNIYVKLLNGAIVTCLSAYFAVSYSLFTYAIVQTDAQAQVREEVIKAAKEAGRDTADIPDWYFTKLVKESDKFDMFRSGNMPGYYGLKNINWLPARFNYAILKKGKPINLNTELIGNLKINSVYIDNTKIFSPRGIVIELNDNPTKYASKEDNVFFIHLIENDEKGFINSDVGLNDFTKIGDKYYYFANGRKGNMKNVVRIDFGFYDSRVGKNSAAFSVPLPLNNKVRN